MTYSATIAAKARADQAFVHSLIAEIPEQVTGPGRTGSANLGKAAVYAKLTHILSDLEKAHNKANNARESVDVITALSADRLQDEYLALRQEWLEFTLKHYGSDHPYCPKFS